MVGVVTSKTSEMMVLQAYVSFFFNLGKSGRLMIHEI